MSDDKNTRPKSYISTHTNEAIYVRDASLVDELIGKVSFTDMIFFHVMGRRPTRADTVILDAVLVTLMEHGFTPSVIATRMIAMSSPEALQAAVAAGLLAVGSQFVGTMEEAATVIQEILEAPEGVDAHARVVAQRFRTEKKPLPGFGHHLHRPDDPRTPRLFEVARSVGVPGKHIEALQALSRHVDEVYGRHITINATGGIAAILGEIGIPAEIMRGMAVISRCAGLVGHIREEQALPTGRKLWDHVEHYVEYVGEAPFKS